MSPHRYLEAAPVNRKYLTNSAKILFALFGIGMIFGLYRFINGLASMTNLNDQYPLGFWIGVDVASGVALAGGGFTTAALIHIFNRGKYSTIGRSAHLTAMLGYTFVAIGLAFDLGRWYNIWHPMLPSMWNGNSALFEVGMCVMLYLSVLYIEFIPIIAERFVGNSPNWIDAILRFLNHWVNKVLWFFLILGVVLSCLHQSSLGTLMVIAPYKIHPLWYTPMLPLFFLISAIAVGFPMVIFESMISHQMFHRQQEMDVLTPLSRMIPTMLGLYFMIRLIQLTINEVWPLAFDGSLQSISFWLEFGIGVALPFFLLLNEKIRRSPVWLFISCTLYILFGVVLNRINVFFIAYQPPYALKQYFPTIGEIMVTVGLISALILVYRAFVIIFPVLPTVKHKIVDPKNT